MEIHNNNNIQGRRTKSEPLIDITRPNREIVRKSVELAQDKRDSLEISPLTAELAQQAEADAELAEATRQAKVSELRDAYVEGRLNSPERIMRAAESILRDQPPPTSN